MAYKFANIKERALYVAKIHDQSYEVFCANIGMSYGSFKGSAKKRPLNSEAIENILTKYPNVNAEWLLTGKGEIGPEQTFNEPDAVYKKSKPSEKTEPGIPLYRLDQAETLAELFADPSGIIPTETIKIPNLHTCDAAIYITGDGMSPLLKTGDIVAYKQIVNLPDEIFWGEIYLISIELAHENYVSVNYVHKSELGNQYIKLVSQNEQFEPKEVLLKKISAMARVKTIIRLLS